MVRLVTAALLAALAALAARPAAGEAVLRLGVVMSLSETTPELAVATLSAIDRWNSAPPCGARLELVARLYDTRGDEGDGLRALFEAHAAGASVIIGAYRSAVTLAMARAASHLPVVMVSPRSTAPALSDRAALPYFARTVMSDDVVALAMVAHIVDHGWRHVGLVHVDDPFGRGLADAIAREAAARRITLVRAGFAFDADDEALRGAMRQMVGITGEPLRVLIVIAFSRHLRPLADGAAAAGVAGPSGHVILNGPEVVQLLPATSPSERRLLHGSVLVEATGDDGSGRFERYLNETWRRIDAASVSASLPPHVGSTANVSALIEAGTPPTTVMFADEAVEAVGRAACNASAGAPAGAPDADALIAALDALRFEGASGVVRFDPHGARALGSAPVRLVSVRYGGGGGGAGAPVLVPVAFFGAGGYGPPLAPLLFANDRAEPPADGQAAVLIRVGLLGRFWGEPTRRGERSKLATALLAVSHFNARNGTFAPVFAALRDEGCDVVLDPRPLHSEGQRASGVEAYLAGRAGGWDVLVGAARSAVSEPVATLAGIHGMPMVSYWSTAPSLSDAQVYPTFGRTIPSDYNIARLVVGYVRQWGWTRAAVLHVNDVAGAAYAQALQRHGAGAGVSFSIIPFTEGDPASVADALDKMTRDEYTITVCLTFLADLPVIVRNGTARGLFSPRQHWIFTDMIGPSEYGALLEPDVALPLLGSVQIEAAGGWGAPAWERFRAQWAAGALAPASELNAYLPPEGQLGAAWWEADEPNDIDALTYDAVATMGLLACRAERDPVGWPVLPRQAWWRHGALAAGFESVTGAVHFDAQSGDRSMESSRFTVRGFMPGTPHLDVSVRGSFVDGAWRFHLPIVFASGASEPPADRPEAAAAAEAASGARGGGGGGGEGEGEGDGKSVVTTVVVQDDRAAIITAAATIALVAAAFATLLLWLRYRAARRRLEGAAAAAERAPPPVPLLVICDAGEDLDDEMALLMAHMLQAEGRIELLGVIANLTPAYERARLVRGTLDVLGLQHVPVGIGTDGGSMAHGAGFLESAEYATAVASQRARQLEPGRALLYRVLSAAPPKSVTLLCISSLKDAALLLRDNAALCEDRLARVVAMGGVDVERSRAERVLVPDSAHNNVFDSGAAEYFYRGCSALAIPVTIVSRHAAYAAPVPRVIYDQLAQSGSPIGWRLRKAQRDSIEGLWRRAAAPPGSAERRGLPERCDAAWFSATFCGGTIEPEGRSAEDPIWDLVVGFNLYDVVALLACVPALRDELFEPLALGSLPCPEPAADAVAPPRLSTVESEAESVGPGVPWAASRAASHRSRATSAASHGGGDDGSASAPSVPRAPSLRGLTGRARGRAISVWKRSLQLAPLSQTAEQDRLAAAELIGESEQASGVRDGAALSELMRDRIAASVGAGSGGAAAVKEVVVVVLREDAAGVSTHGAALTLLALRALLEFNALDCAALLVVRERWQRSGGATAAAAAAAAVAAAVDGGATPRAGAGAGGVADAPDAAAVPSQTLETAEELGIVTAGSVLLGDDDVSAEGGGSLEALAARFAQLPASGVRLVVPAGVPRLLARFAKVHAKLLREKVAEVVGVIAEVAPPAHELYSARAAPQPADATGGGAAPGVASGAAESPPVSPQHAAVQRERTASDWERALERFRSSACEPSAALDTERSDASGPPAVGARASALWQQSNSEGRRGRRGSAPTVFHRAGTAVTLGRASAPSSRASDARSSNVSRTTRTSYTSRASFASSVPTSVPTTNRSDTSAESAARRARRGWGRGMVPWVADASAARRPAHEQPRLPPIVSCGEMRLSASRLMALAAHAERASAASAAERERSPTDNHRTSTGAGAGRPTSGGGGRGPSAPIVLVPPAPTRYPSTPGEHFSRRCARLGVPIVGAPSALVRACALPRSVVDALLELSGDFGRTMHARVRTKVETALRYAAGSTAAEQPEGGWHAREYGAAVASAIDAWEAVSYLPAYGPVALLAVAQRSCATPLFGLQPVALVSGAWHHQLEPVPHADAASVVAAIAHLCLKAATLNTHALNAHAPPPSAADGDTRGRGVECAGVGWVPLGDTVPAWLASRSAAGAAEDEAAEGRAHQRQRV